MLKLKTRTGLAASVPGKTHKAYPPGSQTHVSLHTYFCQTVLCLEKRLTILLCGWVGPSVSGLISNREEFERERQTLHRSSPSAAASASPTNLSDMQMAPDPLN